MKWTDKLRLENPDVYRRLCACNNRREDIPALVNSRWQWMKTKEKYQNGYTKEDALVQIIDWLDMNNQWFDLSQAEWDDLAHE